MHCMARASRLSFRSYDYADTQVFLEDVLWLIVDLRKFMLLDLFIDDRL